LRTEQSAAYPARVRAIYQQYAIDHGYARAERLERETATLAGPECRPAAVENRLKGEVSSAEAADLPEGYTSSPALKGDPYHPDSVASRSTVNQELYAATSRDRAAALGYTTRIPAQKAPFDSHGQEVFTNGKNYITSDVDGHNVTDGWKMFNKRGARIGTYDSELHYVKE
jgi:putative RNase toxin 21 of polymorphic toxin system